MTPERWRHVEELAQAALEREPAERDAFLAEACAADAPLREEVESLLLHHRRAEEEQFLAQPPYELAAEVVAMAGRTLGKYTIERELGRGGMGEVYLAHDARLGRRVALKLLPASFTGDRDRIARFERTRGRSRRRHHPPRREAGERDRPARRLREGARLRPREAHRGDGSFEERRDHGNRTGDGHGRLHVAGTGARAEARRAD